MQLLTAKEMSQILRCTVKTFNRRVKKYGLPFVDSGQRLYNPDKILPMLETVEVERKVEVKPKGRGLNLGSNKYKIMLGI